MNLPEGFVIDEPLAPPPGFEIDDDKSVGGFMNNAANDIGSMAKAGMKQSKAIVDPMNIVESGLQGSLQPTKDYLSQGYKDLKAFPGAIGNEIKQTLTHPIDTAYKHPVNTALNVMGAAGLGKGIWGEMSTVAPEAEMAGSASMADNVARATPEAPSPLEMPSEASQILKEAPTSPMEQPPIAPPKPGASQITSDVMDTIGNKAQAAIKKPMDEVGDFLTEKYGRASAKPGFGQTLGDMAKRKAQSMRFNEMGASPGQIRKLIGKMGEDNVRALSDLAEDRGITDPIVGTKIGKNIDNMEKSSGQTIGGIRKIATQRGATHDIPTLINKIKSELDNKYLKGGTASGEKGAYAKALQDIQNAPPTADGIADAISKLNEYATNNQMVQKKGALTDVANTASRFNNDLIQKHLSPKETEMYESARKDFGASKIFKKMYSFRAGRELAGRSGPGGILRNIKQGAMDIGGNKVMEKFYDKIGDRLNKSPETASSLGSLSDGALSDILSALDEAIDEVGKQ